ncbi:MAG: BON domain-containing protein [Candidatus Solibacter sp.]|nr:BON domain-containing protein [Candidatus Solibacter sp.]
MTMTKWLSCGNRPARALMAIVVTATVAPYGLGADKDKTVGTFNAYVDSDLCAHLMLGPITEARLQCSKDTRKQGSNSVLVRLGDNLVLDVNKTKMIDPLISQIVSATGEVKAKDGRIKLAEVAPVAASTIKPGSADYKLLDVRHFKLTGDDAKTYEKVRHELAMLPYVSEYDFISFTMADRKVILTGWTVRQTNRSSAYNVVKDLPGVEQVTNNIEVLPLGSMDMQARAGVRATLQRVLSRYFWGSGSAIKIVVKNGNVILLGMVSSQSDIDLATIQANSVRGVFKVFNMLQVEAKSSKSGD